MKLIVASALVFQVKVSAEIAEADSLHLLQLNGQQLNLGAEKTGGNTDYTEGRVDNADSQNCGDVYKGGEVKPRVNWWDPPPSHEAEDNSKAACDAKPECKGVWQSNTNDWRLLCPGSRSWAKGVPNDSVASVQVKPIQVQPDSKAPEPRNGKLYAPDLHADMRGYYGGDHCDQNHCGWYRKTHSVCETGFRVVEGTNMMDDECIKAAIKYGSTQISIGPGDIGCRIGDSNNGGLSGRRNDCSKTSYPNWCKDHTGYSRCWTYTLPDREAEKAAAEKEEACWHKYEDKTMDGCYDHTWPCYGEIPVVDKWGRKGFQKSKKECIKAHGEAGKKWGKDCNGIVLDKGGSSYSPRSGPDLRDSPGSTTWRYEC